ncbi:MAG TPA: flagellar biosynthesis protein FliQ [Candidatus Tectomicrobia bacterium]|jgi:flagellar biosynthetic protein FliQ
MTPEFLIDLAARSLQTALLLAAPPLLAGLVVGVLVSIFQAVTQIQEQTLVLVPKILAVIVVLMLCLPWMLQLLLSFTANLFIHLPDYIR